MASSETTHKAEFTAAMQLCQALLSPTSLASTSMAKLSERQHKSLCLCGSIVGHSVLLYSSTPPLAHVGQRSQTDLVPRRVSVDAGPCSQPCGVQD